MRPLALALLLVAPAAWAAPPVVTITGNVLTPSGAAPTKGTITCKLSQPATAADGSVVASEVTFTLATGGALPVAATLVPNDALTPSGTVYTCTYSAVLSGGKASTWSESWRLATSPSSIAIGAITRVATSSGATFIQGPTGATGATGATGPQGPTGPLSWVMFYPDTMTNGQVLARLIMPRAVTIPAGCTGSAASAGTHPTSTAVVALAQNGTPVGSISVATNGTGTWTCSSPIVLAGGDVLTVTGPATADPTLAALSITLVSQ